MTRANNGWFIVPRWIVDEATDVTDLALMVWLLGRANYVDSKAAVRAGHKKLMLLRGQLVTSVKEISDALKVPPNTIRGRLRSCANFDFCTIETTSTGTIITINNYEEMQNFESYDHKPNHNQTTNGPQTDHNIRTKVTKVTKETSIELPEPEKPKQTRVPKKESSGSREVIARYCELFEQKYGVMPKISKQDAGCLSRLAKANGLEQGVKIVETYFRLKDSWLDQQAYPASLVEKNLNKIMVMMTRTQNSAENNYGLKLLTEGDEE